MSGEQLFWSVVASVIVGLLIKLGVALSDHYINVWLALLFGFILVFGGVLIVTGVDW